MVKINKYYIVNAVTKVTQECSLQDWLLIGYIVNHLVGYCLST